jgi:hypothetical protein
MVNDREKYFNEIIEHVSALGADEEAASMFGILSEALVSKIRETQFDIMRNERFENGHLNKDREKRLLVHQKYLSISGAICRFLNVTRRQENPESHFRAKILELLSEGKARDFKHQSNP